MKRCFHALILCLMMLITAGCLSSCMFMGGGVDENGNPQHEEIEGLAGIKACYKPSEYNFDQYDKLNSGISYVESFSVNLLNRLIYAYGIPQYNEDVKEAENSDIYTSIELWKEIEEQTWISHTTDNSKYFERIRFETAKTHCYDGL